MILTCGNETIIKSPEAAFSLPDVCKRYSSSDFYYSIFQNLKLSIMKKNMGNIDRIIRLIVAVVIAVLFFTGVISISSTLGIILAVVAAIFTFTALVSSCPLYSLVGLSTCPIDSKKAG